MERILIVDDDDNIRTLLKSRLTANGYLVQLTDNGLEAFKMIKKGRPDLIIMDVFVPHLDGLSLFQELQDDEELKNIPVLVISGTKSMREIFQPSRTAKFMAKPFEAKDLLAVVKDCIKHAHAD